MKGLLVVELTPNPSLDTDARRWVIAPSVTG
jgi:hypothetical protein